MIGRRFGMSLCVAIACLAWPALARAQSSISGTVKDSSGAVLPGVTVEVSSPALIEGTKSAVTDGSGAYRIVDLRPGMYSVKFTLTGFSTVERSAFQLLSDFNAKIDAEMKVGALEETITVTGAAPIVDVQSSAKIAVLDRDAIDNVPTAKTIQGLGQLILGVSLNAPDVGGSAGAMQTYMSMRGGAVSAANNTVMVDGMVINGMMLDGAVQTYTNDADFQEMTYQTAGVGADRSGGGVTLNLVPKEGGNRFSGTNADIYRPGQLQGDNYTDRIKTWGIPKDIHGDPAIARIEHITDLNISEGGPIQKDKLWFFVSGRNFQPINTVPNVFLNDGTQGLDDNYIRNALVRLTYQVSPKHKIGAYYERVFKWRGHDMSSTGNSDPETSAIVWNSPNYSTEAIKYTGTLSSKLLIEGGFSQNVEYYNLLMQPGIAQTRGDAAWYTNVSKSATGLGVAGAPPPLNPASLIGGAGKEFPNSQVLQGSLSYVTGAHHAKVGAQWKRGQFLGAGDGNGDLQQVYPSGTRADVTRDIIFPDSLCYGVSAASTCSVTIYNTPIAKQESLNFDMGVFAQDSFTMKRLTLSGGIRWEALNAQIDAMSVPGGRFVPSRAEAERTGLPDWTDWAPRFQAVYDLFGDSKTAIKYQFNRYNEAVTTSVASGLNGLNRVTSSRNWTDLNQDGVAQGQRTWTSGCADPSAANCVRGNTYTDCAYLTAGCEIYLSGAGSTQAPLLGTFGDIGDPGIYTAFPRRYRLEQGVEISHALLPRLSLNGTYYHGQNKNLTKTVNTSIVDNGNQNIQYTPVQLYNPIDGTPYTYYATKTGVSIPTTNVTYLEPLRTSSYDNYTADVRLRPYAGAQLTAGIEFNRSLSKDCSTSYPGAVVAPNTLRFCDDRNLVGYDGGPVVGKPFTKNFKASAAFPIVYAINLGITYQNVDSGTISPTYRYGAAASRYPDGSAAFIALGSTAVLPACPTTYGCVPGAATPAIPSGLAAGTVISSQFANGIADERLAQLDLKASKNLRFGRVSVQPNVEAFNILNVDSIRGRQSSEYAVAAGTYLQPSNTLQGRIIGFGVNIKW